MIHGRHKIPQLSAVTKVCKEGRVPPITPTYEVLRDDLGHVSGIKLNNDRAMKNPLPSAMRSLPPRAPLIPDPYRLLHCTPTPTPTPGFSTCPFPSHPGHGPSPPHTQYGTASSVRVTGSLTLRDPTRGPPGSISILPRRGSISIFPRKGVSIIPPTTTPRERRASALSRATWGRQRGGLAHFNQEHEDIHTTLHPRLP